jgi:hypothetical protein
LLHDLASFIFGDIMARPAMLGKMGLNWRLQNRLP